MDTVFSTQRETSERAASFADLMLAEWDKRFGSEGNGT